MKEQPRLIIRDNGSGYSVETVGSIKEMLDMLYIITHDISKEMEVDQTDLLLILATMSL